MCGCINNITVSKNTTTTSSRQQVATPINKGKSVCGNKYSELLELDLRIISVLKKQKDSLLSEFTKKIRGWIKKLHEECPNYYELNVIKEYIENEYPINNTQ